MSKRDKPIPDQGPEVRLSINLRRVIKIVFFTGLGIELFLVFLDFKVNYSYGSEIGALQRLCNITREDGLASWVGVTITALAALTLWAIYLVEQRLNSGKWTRIGWLILAIFFSYMAMDDGSGFHERMGTTFGEIQDRQINSPEGPTSLVAKFQDKFPSYSWQVVYMPIFGSLGAFTFIFLWFKFKSAKRRIALVCAFTLMGLALFLDFVEGLEPDHKWNLYTIITDTYKMNVYTITHFREMAYDACRHFSKSIEEFMEMLAMTIFWVTFIGYLGSRAPKINLTFNE